MSATLFKLESPDDYQAAKLTAPTGGYTAGKILTFGDAAKPGVIAADAAATEEAVVIFLAAKIRIGKKVTTGMNFAVGDAVYVDAAAQKATTVATGNIAFGICVEAAATASTEVLVSMV